MNALSLRPVFVWLAVLGLVGAGVGAVYALARTSTDPRVCDALGRARVIRVLGGQGASLRCPGVTVEELDARTVASATPELLIAALQRQKGSAAALVPGSMSSGIGAELGRFAYVPGLRAVVLAPQLVVYAPVREPELGDKEREALAHVARALLRGAREPSLSSFPPSLRRVERVEVMVSLISKGEPRLWRSARGTNIARALLTATRVARDRWQERETAMGGPLRDRLGQLDVEVSLLSEDGTFTNVKKPFVDKATRPEHGLGFDHRSNWHYVLPLDVARRGKGSPHAALVELAKDQGLAASVLEEPNTRVYRFVVLPLGSSRATDATPVSGARSD